jgi:hypothetical protein
MPLLLPHRVYLINNHYEVSSGVARKYYYAGGQRIAMREGTNVPLWLFGDHLGSTSYTANPSAGSGQATEQGEVRYKPFGATRYSSAPKGHPTPTTYRRVPAGRGKCYARTASRVTFPSLQCVVGHLS